MKRIGGWLAAAGLVLLMPFGASAATACAWTVEANPGVDIAIDGTRFAPNTEVILSWDVNGGPVVNATVETDGNGEFEYSIPAGPGLGGRYHVNATDGACSLEQELVAVETASGGGTLPPSDTEPAAPVTPSGPLGALAGLLAIGTIVGILVLRVGRRTSR